MSLLEKNVFERRDVTKVLTNDQKKALEIITGPKDPEEYEGFFTIYGSMLYASQPFPSDIDGTQIYKFCKKDGCSEQKANGSIVIILKEVVTKILNTNGFYLGDIKIGIDKEIESVIYEVHENTYDKIKIDFNELFKKNKKRYIDLYGKRYLCKLDEIEIPQLLINDKLVSFEKDKVIQIWKKAYEKGVISDKNFEDIKKIVPGKMNGRKGMDSFFTYCEYIRNLLILRWTGKEVLDGVKYIGDRKITIFQAVKSAVKYFCPKNCHELLGECVDNNSGKKTNYEYIAHLIKIDMFAVADGKIMEYSNLFSTNYIDKNKNEKLLSYSILGDLTKNSKKILIDSLATDMTQYYLEVTKKYKKAMKYAKRMYVISLLSGNKKVGIPLVNLFKSDINYLNYINGQVDVVLSILVDHEDAPMKIIMNQLEGLKFDISKITGVKLDKEKFYKQIDDIIEGNKSREEIIKSLSEIKKHYLEIINEEVKKYLKKVKLWPGPYFRKENFAFVYG